MQRLLLTALGATLAATAVPALGDTTDVRWATTVVVAKQGDHCADDPNSISAPMTRLIRTFPTRS